MTKNLNKIPVILLAAGDSKRMGTPKGLLEFKEEPFVLYQIEKLKSIGFNEIIIVLGRSMDEYFKAIPEIKNHNIVINPHPERGIFSSIQCGLETISENRTGVFILPIDVPCPLDNVWKKMLDTSYSSNVNVVVPSFEGKKGHPVLLLSDFKNHILTCSSDSRLDFEIRKQEKQQKVKIISVKDSTILLNLNTIEDWNAFKVL